MSLLPPSTNAQYAGSVGAARVLAIFGVLTIVPGCIHEFLPDGGAGTIAGLDLGSCGPSIVALFAWAGATQIVFGVAMLVASLRYRPLVPLMLALLLVERTLHAWNGWLWKTGTGHHPPEHYAVVLTWPVIVLALVASLRPTAARPGRIGDRAA